jgi:F0F1-type ATP synthase membrane subunit a
VAIGAILLLELMVALLQVFVFATLCSLYLVDAHNPNH